MRWLVVCSTPQPDSIVHEALRHVVTGLQTADHHVDVIHIEQDEFEVCMSADEHRNYDTVAEQHPDPMVAAHIEFLLNADGLVFVFPTQWSVPAALKGWCERILLPGVAFVLHPTSQLIKPNLRNIRHLAVVTTNPKRAHHRLGVGDPARRLIMRSIRAICHRRCRTKWLSLYDCNQTDAVRSKAFLDNITATFEAL